MEDIGLLVIGLSISVLGIINICGNISTIHSYNRRNVKEEDIPKYGRTIGMGTLVMGLSLIAAFASIVLGCEISTDYIVIPAIAVGLGIMLYGQLKYNKGLF